MDTLTLTPISVGAAVERTGLSEHTIRYYIRVGKLRAWRVGTRRIGLDPAEVEALIRPIPPRSSKTA